MTIKGIGNVFKKFGKWCLNKVKAFIKLFWQIVRSHWYELLALVALLGVWDIIGREIYEVYIKEIFRPSVIVFPRALEFNRNNNIEKQVFVVKNRSSETRFNIRLFFIEGDLDRRFENIEIEPMEKLNRVTVKNREMAALTSDFSIEMYGDSTMGPSKDPDTKWIEVKNIFQMKGGEERLFLVKFKSIRTDTPQNEIYFLQIESEYDKVPFLKTGKKTPKDNLPYMFIKAKQHRTFKYKEAQFIVFTDERNIVWFLANPVLEELEIENRNEAIDNLTYDSKSRCNLDYSNGSTKKQQIIINELGLRMLTKISPNKTSALAFEKWVSDTVLPAIKRK